MTTRTAPDQVTGRDRPGGTSSDSGIDSFPSMIADRGLSAPRVRRNFDLPRDCIPLA